MTVTFCGHRQLQQPDEVRQWLYAIIQKLILQGADTFYLGGYGAFDEMAAGVLGEWKKQYPKIQRLLVLAYPNRVQSAGIYDGTVYPPLESVPHRLAIVRRNQWMVDAADVVVACISHDWGGAAVTLRYARKKKVSVLLYSGR